MRLDGDVFLDFEEDFEPNTPEEIKERYDDTKARYEAYLKQQKADLESGAGEEKLREGTGKM